MGESSTLHGTTILAVRHRGGCAIAGDGQVTLGKTVMKHGARKIRRLHNGQVLAGFARPSAAAPSCFAGFGDHIAEYRRKPERASVDPTHEARTHRLPPRLPTVARVSG